MNEIEDEIHFLFRCSKYSTIRNAFYNKTELIESRMLSSYSLLI